LCSTLNQDEAMYEENTNVTSSLAGNGTRFSWPEIGDDDLLPADLSRGLKLTFVVAYTAIILMALGGNGLMANCSGLLRYV